MNEGIQNELCPPNAGINHQELKSGSITQLKPKKKNNPLITVCILSGCFVASWTPYVIYVLWKTRDPGVPPLLELFAFHAIQLNAVCNPILYTMTNRRFGRYVKQLLRRFVPRCLLAKSCPNSHWAPSWTANSATFNVSPNPCWIFFEMSSLLHLQHRTISESLRSCYGSCFVCNARTTNVLCAGIVAFLRRLKNVSTAEHHIGWTLLQKLWHYHETSGRTVLILKIEFLLAMFFAEWSWKVECNALLLGILLALDYPYIYTEWSAYECNANELRLSWFFSFIIQRLSVYF